jgi:hypothetical protein
MWTDLDEQIAPARHRLAHGGAEAHALAQVLHPVVGVEQLPAEPGAAHGRDHLDGGRERRERCQ